MRTSEEILWREEWNATMRLTIKVTAGRDRLHSWVIGADDWLTGSASVGDFGQAEIDILGQLGCM